MRKLYVSGILIVLALMTSCLGFFPCIEGTGDAVEEIRDISDFYSVTNATSFDVYVSQADTFSVRVVASENLLPLVETYRSGGSLLVKTRELSCITGTSPVEVYVSMPEIEQLNLTASGTMNCSSVHGDEVELGLTGSGIMNIDTVVASELYMRNSASGHLNCLVTEAPYGDVRMSGSGEIDFGDLTAEELEVRHSSSGIVRGGIHGAATCDISLSGSGRVVLYGDSEEILTSHSASGRLDVLDVLATDAETHSSGSGNTYVNVSGLLDVTILGSGNVIYKGNPEEFIYRITGSGNVRPY